MLWTLKQQLLKILLMPYRWSKRMDEKADFLQNQVMPGVGDDTPLQFNFNLSVPPSMVNKPGLWQQLFLQLKDVYPVDLEEDLGKVLVVQPVEGLEGNDCDNTQFLFNWIDVVNSIEAGDGIEVDSTDPRVPVISVKLSTDQGNNITIGADGGVFANTYEAGDSLGSLAEDGVVTFNVQVSGDALNAITLGTDGNLFAYKVTVNGIVQDADGEIVIGPEDIGEYGVVPFGPGGNIPVDPADIGPNGVPELDINGKIPLDYINEALIGAVSFKTFWEASTNTPTLPTAAEENKGWYYIATDDGVIPGTSIAVRENDWVLSDGDNWGLLNALDGVVTVAGKSGVVTLSTADIISGVFSAARLASGTPTEGQVVRVNASGEPVWADAPVPDVTKAYVDSGLAGKFDKTGGTVTGNITATGNIVAQSGSLNAYGWSGNNNTGVLYLGLNSNQKYLYFDGTRFDLYGGDLNVSTGAITASGNVTAYSDSRLKNITGHLTNTWDKLKDINSYYYTWNDKATFATEETRKKTHLGVSAQEVKAQFPELVLESEEGVLSVDYGRLAVVLLDVVKELQDRVEALEAKS